VLVYFCQVLHKRRAVAKERIVDQLLRRLLKSRSPCPDSPNARSRSRGRAQSRPIGRPSGSWHCCGVRAGVARSVLVSPDSINNVVRCRAIQTLRSGAGFRAPGPSSGRQAYPAVDPALEAGARTDSSLAPARASPPSIAMRPRVAARSPIARRIVAGDEVDHRRVCAPLVASLAADAREAEPQLIKRSSHPCAHRHRPLRRARAWRRVCR
jgi:hypothetical protein